MVSLPDPPILEGLDSDIEEELNREDGGQGNLGAEPLDLSDAPGGLPKERTQERPVSRSDSKAESTSDTVERPAPVRLAQENSVAEDLGESVDEVLTHATEQTVRMVGLAEVVGGLREAVDDLREETHAGIGEIRRAQETANLRDLVDELAARAGNLEVSVDRNHASIRTAVSMLVVLLVVALGLAGGIAYLVQRQAASPTTAGVISGPPELQEEFSQELQPAPADTADSQKVDVAKKRRKKRRR